MQPAPEDDASPSARERAAVIYRIRNLVEYWGITPEELAGEVPAPEPTPPACILPVKYRHPVTGDTWDGSGAHPQWLRDALLKEGYTVEQLKPPADGA